MGYKIGIDTGGTFTDFFLVDEQGNTGIHKVESTPADFSIGMMNGLSEIAQGRNMALNGFLSQVDTIVHGTTVTTNAILTGRYAKTGFITTKDFRDLLNTRRGLKKHQYEAKEAPPPPLVPRYLIRPVQERIDCDGNVLIPLNEEDVYSATEVFKKEKVETIAVSFLFSFFNPSHEQRVRQIIEQELPGVYVCLSSEVLPQVRVYERNSTTVLNACVGPLLTTYIKSLVERLKQGGFAGVLLIMQSNSGVMSPEVATRFASRTLLSGPAAGPPAGIYYGEIHNLKNVITIDMGGTSFDACLVREGILETTTEAEVAEYRIASPSLAIKSIGAGGGSIARVDMGGILRVGPASAGAEPGPVCYGRGGEEATVTDADLVLGYLNPDYFLGGKMKLDTEKAKNAIKEKIADKLNLDVMEAAHGIYELINSNMAQAVRLVSIARGIDPREYALVIGGGAGPVHSAMIAQELEIPMLIIPKESSVFCAKGMLLRDFRHDMARVYYMPITEEAIDLDRINALIKEMRDAGFDILQKEGIPTDRMRLDYSIDLRYWGQFHEIEIPLPMRDEVFAKEDLPMLWEAFHKTHERLYGYAMPGLPLESVNVRALALGITDKPSFKESPFAGENVSGALKARREIFLKRKWIEVPIYDGTKMNYGNKVSGPAIIEEPTTTILVTADRDLTCDRYGNYIMHPKGMSVEETVKKMRRE
jgi:N-methylhydantoinase A